MRHIKRPVTIPAEKAEKLYVAAEAVGELAALIHNGVSVDSRTIPINLLRILGEQFSEGLSDVSFPFED
jgi:hypothetical protein